MSSVKECAFFEKKCAFLPISDAALTFKSRHVKGFP